MRTGAKLAIWTAAVAAGFAVATLPHKGCAEIFMREKNRAEQRVAETSLVPRTHRILVVGHSWAEGAFRKGREGLESSIRFFQGLDVSFKVCSRSGSSIGDARWQLDQNFEDGISGIAVFAGRNDWRHEDWQIEADLMEFFSALAKKGRPVFVFNSQEVLPGTMDGEVINRKVEMINSTLERMCGKYGFRLVNVKGIDVGEMRDPYHPKSYEAVQKLFALELERELSAFSPIFSSCKADRTAVGFDTEP